MNFNSPYLKKCGCVNPCNHNPQQEHGKPWQEEVYEQWHEEKIKKLKELANKIKQKPLDGFNFNNEVEKKEEKDEIIDVLDKLKAARFEELELLKKLNNILGAKK